MKNFTLPMLLQVKVVNKLLCYLSGQKSKAVAGEMARSRRNRVLKAGFLHKGGVL